MGWLLVIEAYRLAVEHEMPSGWKWFDRGPPVGRVWLGVQGEMPDAEYGYGDDEQAALAMLLGKLVFRKRLKEHLKLRSEWYWNE